MKKIAGRAAAMAMAVVMMSGASGAAVFAAETDKSEDKVTKISYDQSAVYTWSVPADFNFTTGVRQDNKITYSVDGDNGKVQISKNIIEADYTVNVTVKGDGEDGKFIIKDSSNGDTLDYQIFKTGENVTEEEVKPGSVVLTTKAGHTGEQALKFVLDLTEYEKAGKYTGNATFTAKAEKTATESE